MTRRVSWTGLVLVVLAGCGGAPVAEHDATPHDAEVAAPSSNRIDVPEPVRQNLGITFATVEYRSVARTLRLPGRFEADADARRDYAAPVAGVVELLVKPYQRVEVGTPLYRISGSEWTQFAGRWHEASHVTGDSPASAARNRLLTATAARMAGLPVDDRRVTALVTASALTVHAQVAGVIEPQVAIAGAMQDEGDPILSTIDPSRVRFRATALQGDLGRLRDDLPAAIVPGTDSHVSRMPARMVIGLEADPVTRGVDVIAWPTAEERPTWSRPGMAALLELTLAGGDEELAIPRAATMRDGLVTVLFKRDPKQPDQVIRMEADLGVDDGVWVQVLSGLKEGDQVVVGGIYPLLLSGAGKAAKAGHFHADGTFHEGGH